MNNKKKGAAFMRTVIIRTIGRKSAEKRIKDRQKGKMFAEWMSH